MKKSFFLLLLPLAVAHAKAAPRAKLWAVASVAKTVFHEDMTHDTQCMVEIANDSAQNIVLEWDSFRLFLNSKEIKDRLETRLAPDTIKSITLSPGQNITLARNIGPNIERPGAYTLIWQIKGIKTVPVTFRVISLKDKVPDEVRLVREIRQKMPAGWHANYDPISKWIDVEHDPVRDPSAYEPLRVGTRSLNPPGSGPFGMSLRQPGTLTPTYRANPQTAPAFGGGADNPDDNDPAMHDPAKFRLKKGIGDGTFRPSVAFEVLPFLAPDEWQRRKETNTRIYKLMTDISSKLPRFGWQMGEYEPKTPEDAKQFAVYKQLDKARFELPEFHYRQICVDLAWPRAMGGNNSGGFGGPSPIFPETEKAIAQQDQMIELVESLLERYEPKVTP